MTKPGDKTKKKKKRKAVKGSREFFVREKTSKLVCAVCSAQLHGTPHGKKVSEVAKMGKTQKRPSVPFGGVLCTKCRRLVAVEKAQVEAGIKDINAVELRIKKFINIKEEAK